MQSKLNDHPPSPADGNRMGFIRFVVREVRAVVRAYFAPLRPSYWRIVRLRHVAGANWFKALICAYQVTAYPNRRPVRQIH